MLSEMLEMGEKENEKEKEEMKNVYVPYVMGETKGYFKLFLMM
jgi:hypothetical protein